MSNIESAIDGLNHGFRERLIEMPSENASVLANFILSIKHESASISNSHRCNVIKAVYYLSAHLDNIPFKSITRDDFMSFLDSYRKPDNVDPMHKWIGTYNLYYSLLCRFFKWLPFLIVAQL